MAGTLTLPEHAWKEGSVAYGVEVAIDLLPSEFEGKWLEVVEMSTDKWVRSNGLKKPATLWMWGTMSINFHQLGWSEYVVPVGLSKPFLIHLHKDLSNAFREAVRFSEGIQLVRNEGWAAICHIQDGIVWVEEDADLWAPYSDTDKF